MRTSIVLVALTAGATAALDQYHSNNATYNNIIDYSFEDVNHHQGRKLSNLFSAEDDEQQDSSLNIFDVDTGDKQGVATRKKHKKDWKCRVKKRVKKCRRGKVERWTKRKKQKCCRNWPPPDVEEDGSDQPTQPTLRPTKRPTKQPSQPKPQPRPTKRPTRQPSKPNPSPPSPSGCKVQLYGQCTTDQMCCEGTCEPIGVTTFGGFSMFLCCLGGSCPDPDDMLSPSPPTKRPTKKPAPAKDDDCLGQEEYCWFDSQCCSKNCGYICVGSSCYTGCK